jgi:putative membrane protein
VLATCHQIHRHGAIFMAATGLVSQTDDASLTKRRFTRRHLGHMSRLTLSGHAAAMNRAVTIAAAVAGAALLAGIIIAFGAGHVVHAVTAIGWRGLAYVIAWQLAVYGLLGVAWRQLVVGGNSWLTIWGRLVREGGETCLPFSEIGGLLLGARALMLGGIPFAEAAASSISDILSEAIALGPFLLFGLLILVADHPGSKFVLPLALGLVLLLAGGAAAYGLRGHLAKLLHAATTHLLKPWSSSAPADADALRDTLQSHLTQPVRMATATILHLAAWCGGGGNVWIAYHLLGAHPSVIDALAIEAILSGVLAVGFLIPAGLGVQELTYVGVGRLFGIPAHVSLALSLIRRARDIAIGAPALVSWQIFEAKGLNT